MSLGVVIVTYKDRLDLTIEVTKSIIRYAPDIICVVVNGYSKYSILELERKLSGLNIRFIKLEQNLGSATGFKIGISALSKLCSIVLLLDDDNMLTGSKSEINVLIDNINYNKNIVYSIYRNDRPELRKSFLENNPELIIGKPNSFLSFDIFSKILFYVGINFKRSNSPDNQLLCAPYGGLLFHTDTLIKVGLPFKDFFSYGDDYEWTYRFSLAGIKIIHTNKLRIVDLEKSWHVSNENTFQKLQKCDIERFELIVQNRKKFEKIHRVSNNFIYKINKYIFILIFIMFNGDKTKIKILRK